MAKSPAWQRKSLATQKLGNAKAWQRKAGKNPKGGLNAKGVVSHSVPG